MRAGDDERAPGAAITVELRGGVDHPPPCPLARTTWPHTARTTRRLRVLFAAPPEREAEVRRRIVAALGRRRLLSDAPCVVRPFEADHAGRLLAS
jgi:hypothetical protein